eukprot:64369_1
MFGSAAEHDMYDMEMIWTYDALHGSDLQDEKHEDMYEEFKDVNEDEKHEDMYEEFKDVNEDEKHEDMYEEFKDVNEDKKAPGTSFVFYFGKDKKILYSPYQYPPYDNDKIYECYSLNIERPFDFPDNIYLSGMQLNSEYINCLNSEQEKYALYKCNKFGLKENFTFYFNGNILYIVTNMDKDLDIYTCTRVHKYDNNDGFPDTIYLTKSQFNNVEDVTGLEFIKSRAILCEYNMQKKRAKELESTREMKEKNSKVNELKVKYLHHYFCLSYNDSDHMVYYVDEIESENKLKLKISKKNGNDRGDSDHPFPETIWLNEKELNQLDEFKDKGHKLQFEEDIYSLHASFYFKQNKGPGCLCVFTTFIFMVQLMSLLAILWCFDVSYTEDIIKNYQINELRQCFDVVGVAQRNNSDIHNSTYCLSLANEPTPANATNKTNITNAIYTTTTINTTTAVNTTMPINTTDDNTTMTTPTWNAFSLIEDNSYTQQFATKQPSWYLLGYACTAFTSLLLLTVYVSKTMVSPVKLLVALKYVDSPTMTSATKFKIVFIAFLNGLLITFAYGIGCWTITSSPFYFGMSDPFQLLTLPIGIVFILEVDDWGYQFIKIAFAKHIATNFGIHITQSALFELGKSSLRWIIYSFWLEIMVCDIIVLIVYEIVVTATRSVSGDINNIFMQIGYAIIGYFAFLHVAIFGWMFVARKKGYI